MNLRTLLFSFISLISVAAFFCPFISYPNSANLPFFTIPTAGGAVAIEPVPGVPLPRELKAGDVIAWQAITPEARMTVWAYGLKVGKTYPITVLRDGKTLTVPVISMKLASVPFIHDQFISNQILGLLLLVLMLITLWRGRDWAAWGLTLFGFSGLLIILLGIGVPSTPYISFALFSAGHILYLSVFFGMYLTVDSLASVDLTHGLHRMFRWILGVLFGLLGIWVFSRTLGAVFFGWPPYLWSPAVVLIQIAFIVILLAYLITGYVHSKAITRLRIRWIFAATFLITLGITINDFNLGGTSGNVYLVQIFLTLAVAGYLYGVLRHRLVDVSFVINRTLVYGAVTALVVGILAAINVLVERAALGTNASLLLQMVLPLSLGIVLSRVRITADRLVEQVFFRRKYRAAKALRRFARYATRYSNSEELLAAAVAEIHEQLGAPAVSIYDRKDDGYSCTQHAGELLFPQYIKLDDPAFVAARTDQRDIDISELHSDIGSDGYVFPLMALGNLQGVLVCANRSGERYAADERKLLIHVAIQMGMALYTLRMQSKSKLVDALASGLLTSLPDIQAQARTLVRAASSA